MKPSLLFFCLLTATAFCSANISSPSSSSSGDSSSVSHHSESQPTMPAQLRLSLPLSKRKLKSSTLKVVEDKMMRSIDQESSDGLQISNNNDLDEPGYHIDYHGVTTHPTPTPKHP